MNLNTKNMRSHEVINHTKEVHTLLWVAIVFYDFILAVWNGTIVVKKLSKVVSHFTMRISS